MVLDACSAQHGTRCVTYSCGTGCLLFSMVPDAHCTVVVLEACSAQHGTMQMRAVARLRKKFVAACNNCYFLCVYRFCSFFTYSRGFVTLVY